METRLKDVLVGAFNCQHSVDMLFILKACMLTKNTTYNLVAQLSNVSWSILKLSEKFANAVFLSINGICRGYFLLFRRRFSFANIFSVYQSSSFAK